MKQLVKRDYSEITPKIEELSQLCVQDSIIQPEMYKKYNVNRGLRDLNGKGVLTGLTEISEIEAKMNVDGEEIPCEGKLFYRGYNIKDLTKGFMAEKRFGFEEITYLLLFGELPTEKQLAEFCEMLADYRSLPNSFVRDLIMKSPSSCVMNSLARSVLNL